MKNSKYARKTGASKSQAVFNYRDGSITKENGEEVFLEYRLKEFFAVLFEHKNGVVTRQDLMRFVWKDVVVNDESITKAASDLRRFLKSNSLEEFNLITIPKIGYKLMVSTSDLTSKTKRSLVARSLRIVAYIFLSFLLLITIVRAVNY